MDSTDLTGRVETLHLPVRIWASKYTEIQNGLRAGAGVVQGSEERVQDLSLTHGYGYNFTVKAYTVCVTENGGLRASRRTWDSDNQKHESIESDTQPLDVLIEGLPEILSKYADDHLADSNSFNSFVKKQFDSIQFSTDTLTRIYSFETIQNQPVVKKPLKLLVIYNLCMASMEMSGSMLKTTTSDSPKALAPVLVATRVKLVLADMWRSLYSEVATELDTLYDTGDARSWPSIIASTFVCLFILEEMQFDYHMHVERKMEEIESAVIELRRLFNASRQRLNLPVLADWGEECGQQLTANERVFMAETRRCIDSNEMYLCERRDCNAVFDEENDDSYANAFIPLMVFGKGKSLLFDGQIN